MSQSASASTDQTSTGDGPGRDFVVVANRLPVDRAVDENGSSSWHRSPGGLVSALAPVMASNDGAWVGWAGSPDEQLEPFDHDVFHLVPVELSAREFAMARAFLESPGQVLTREQLLNKVWGYDFEGSSNVVDVYVRYLRNKLGPERIITVRGAGYRLAEI